MILHDLQYEYQFSKTEPKPLQISEESETFSKINLNRAVNHKMKPACIACSNVHYFILINTH